MSTPEILELALAVAGVVGTLFFGIKAETLKRRLQRFEWTDIATGISYLRKQLSTDHSPHLILSVSVPGAIIANLLLAESEHHIPLYSAISFQAHGSEPDCKPSYGNTYRTSKWITYIPDEIFRFSDKKLLIFDDCVLTGDTLRELLVVLTAQGFKRENIVTMALFVSELAIQSGKSPDLFWMKANESGFYLPWGKSLGRGF